MKNFCKICDRCATACPVKAIAFGEPKGDYYNQSNLQGVTKWNVDAEKCFDYWVRQNTDCCICLRACPYNKDFSKWTNRVGLFLAGTRLRKWMLKLHDRMGYGKLVKPDGWWTKVNQGLIKIK